MNNIRELRIGTTIATNALLEHKGAKTLMVLTQGFKDLLLIGNQSRPEIFNLKVNKPKPLYSEVIECEERIVL